MALWTADVYCGPQIGHVTAEVEAATHSGARQQIHAKYSNVQTITNLREVRGNSSSSGSGGDVGGSMAAVGLIAGIWILIQFTPWILMALGGAVATWIGEKMTGQSIEEYTERDDDLGHGKAAIVLALALLCGGFGFYQGTELKKQWDAPNPPAQIQSKNS